jgi:hypothetical protein
MWKVVVKGIMWLWPLVKKDIVDEVVDAVVREATRAVVKSDNTLDDAAANKLAENKEYIKDKLTELL